MHENRGLPNGLGAVYSCASWQQMRACKLRVQSREPRMVFKGAVRPVRRSRLVSAAPADSWAQRTCKPGGCCRIARGAGHPVPSIPAAWRLALLALLPGRAALPAHVAKAGWCPVARRAASQDVLADMVNVAFCWRCFYASRHVRPHPFWRSERHKAALLCVVAPGARGSTWGTSAVRVAQAGQELATMSVAIVVCHQENEGSCCLRACTALYPASWDGAPIAFESPNRVDFFGSGASGPENLGAECDARLSNIPGLSDCV